MKSPNRSRNPPSCELAPLERARAPSRQSRSRLAVQKQKARKGWAVDRDERQPMPERNAAAVS